MLTPIQNTVRQSVLDTATPPKKRRELLQRLPIRLGLTKQSACNVAQSPRDAQQCLVGTNISNRDIICTPL